MAIGPVLVVALSGLVGCKPNRTPAATTAVAQPATGTRAMAIAAARRCGRTLGVAVRCNLVRDDRDFAVVR